MVSEELCIGTGYKDRNLYFQLKHHPEINVSLPVSENMSTRFFLLSKNFSTGALLGLFFFYGGGGEWAGVGLFS